MMASTSRNAAAYGGGGGSGPPSPNTTFVQADPSTFRTIVQKLTGAADDSSAQKLPISTTTTAAHYNSNRPLPVPGPKRPAFKLNERRQSAAKNLQINLINNINNNCSSSMFQFRQQQRGGCFMVSPVSTLDFINASARIMSPRSDEEERAIIAEKGFYNLNPPVSPNYLMSTPRAEPPELLPLFPLRSPKDLNVDHDRSSSCS